MSELQGLQTILPEMRDLGAEVVAISTDTSEELNQKLLPKGIDFPLLADPDFRAIDAYGVRHLGADPFGDGDIARPAVFIISEDGRRCGRI